MILNLKDAQKLADGMSLTPYMAYKRFSEAALVCRPYTRLPAVLLAASVGQREMRGRRDVRWMKDGGAEGLQLRGQYRCVLKRIYV